mgnify:CR=1 FL=1
MKFLGNVFATVIGIFVFFMVAFFGILLIGIIAGGDDNKVIIKDNSVIELDLSKVTLDYAGKVNFKDFNYFETNHNGLIDILNAIENAKTDEKIKGISNKMFTQTVRDLEKDGLIYRKVYPVVPPKVEYKLSDRGKSLEKILRSLDKWGLDDCQN